MKSETKNCQNCKQDFIIESEDFNFYEKIKVPPPTFCPECRYQRRMARRNEKSLYKSTCTLCQKGMISMYPKDSIFPVYCKECWHSDKWDATIYGREYDFSRSFFEQYKELSGAVPCFNLWQRNVIDSPYSNMAAECKNVYLSISATAGSENIFYSKSIDKSFNIFDSFNVKESDSCYENVECEKNYNCFYLKLSKNCIDSYFLIDCVNCSNCILSSNLRNKEYYIRNKQYSKEDYLKEVEGLALGSRKAAESLNAEFDLISEKAIYRYANIFKSVSSSGNNLLNTKNCKYCFDVYNSEDVKFGYRFFNIKDSMDTFYAIRSELLYEYITGALNAYNVKFSLSAIDTIRDADYTDSCVSSNNLFGCIGIKNKSNVILNKVYSEEEYIVLRDKIIKQMNDMPYVDKNGRIYKYGEFFPIEISPFNYNETIAQEYFPLTKKEVVNDGYLWDDSETKNYNITILGKDVPDDIKEVDDKIIVEVLGCVHDDKCNHRCLKAFHLTIDEFRFYKKHNIPIPNKCSNCRYHERFAEMPPLKLWHRKCMKEGCQNEFETSYAPDRPEVVYCERCYQQEVY